MLAGADKQDGQREQFIQVFLVRNKATSARSFAGRDLANRFCGALNAIHGILALKSRAIRGHATNGAHRTDG